MSGKARQYVDNEVAKRRGPRVGAAVSSSSSTGVVLFQHRRSVSSSDDGSSDSDSEYTSGSDGGAANDESRFPLGDIKALEDGSKCAERVFHVVIVGSPDLFSRVPDAAVSVLASPYSIQYRSADTPIGSERTGDISDALILHCHVQWCQNTFAWPVMVSSKELHGRYYAGDNRGFLSIPGGHTFFSTSGLGVHRPTRSLTNGIVKRYGTYGEKDFKSGVTKLKGNRTLVDVGSVAHKILIENEQSAPEKEFWYNVDRDFANRTNDRRIKDYTVPTHLVEKAEKAFNEDYLASKPHVDMGQMTVAISRLFGEDWDAPYGYSLPGSKETADSRIKELGGSVTVALRIKYRLKKPIRKEDN